MPFQQLQPARLVAGQRAERQVVTDQRHVRDVRPVPTVRPQVRVPRLLPPAGVQVRQQQRGEYALRLLDTAQPAGEHRLGQRHRLLVPAERGEVFDLVRRVATGTVGEFVPGCGGPPAVPLRGLVRRADVHRHLVPVFVDHLEAVAAAAIAPLHVVEYRHRAVQRNLGKLEQAADHVLEIPEQGVQVPLLVRPRVAVELGQAPGEGDERPGRLAAVVVGGGGEHPGREPELLVAGGVHLPEQCFGGGDLTAAVRHLADPVDRPPEVVGVPAHRHSCPGTARPSRPRNELFNRAASAGRIGW
ncbi:hypothetical protein [Plantactinospora sp. BB1]|uniref:hypothetical protein n=1 Tax=Plantactinospora sp. BB1 TaxID=2071627 RepID=UPI00131EF88A|nr:hypothetical protein [Plantactinospora sp. BB1]